MQEADAAVDAEFADFKAARYDGYRTWDTLGYYNEVWRGKEVMPWRFHNRDGQWIDATPNYYGALETHLTKAKHAGLTVHHSRGDLVSSDAQERYRAAIEAGVLKILSKMGVSTIDSYRGAQLFEVVGLADEVVDVCFTGSSNVVGGLGWRALGEDALAHHMAAFPAGRHVGEVAFQVDVRRAGDMTGEVLLAAVGAAELPADV